MDDALAVLYFEDDASLAGLVIDYLSTQGFICHHYYEFPPNGLAQLREDIKQPVAVVLLDINMAGKSGYEICELLKAEYLPSNVPVVFTSGLMQDEDILKAYAAGADDYLVKPFVIDELLARCRALLRRVFAAVEQSTATYLSKLTFPSRTSFSRTILFPSPTAAACVLLFFYHS